MDQCFLSSITCAYTHIQPDKHNIIDYAFPNTNIPLMQCVASFMVQFEVSYNMADKTLGS